MSNKSSILKQLKEDHCIFFTRNELYKALCSYNDRMGRVYTLSELESLLNGHKSHLNEFADYLLEEFEPESKIVA